MYNYQLYLKENKLQKKFDQIRKQYNNSLHQKQKSSPNLIQSHKKRIEGFILALLEKPTPITLYQDQRYEPRIPQKSQSIHEKNFHLNHLSQKQRVQQILDKSSVCDPVPFSNTFSHKFRDFKNQTNFKPMRFKAINASLRVKQELEQQMLNYLPNLRNKKIDKLIKSPQISWKNQSFVKQLNKSLLPMMHKKTYFQSLKSIFTESPQGFLKNLPKNQKQNSMGKLEEHDSQIQLQLASKKQKNIGQNMNRKENSRQALIKCGFLSTKRTAYVIGMQKTSKKIFAPNNTQSIRG